MTGTAAPPPRSSEVEVVESWPARIHRPLDLVRLLALVVVLLLLTGLVVVARETSRGAGADLARLFGHLPSLVGQGLRLVSAFSALAFPLALIAREIVRGYRRRLIEAVLTGLLAMGVAEGVDRVVTALPSSALYAALTGLPSGATAAPLDAYLTALFAFAAVVGVGDDKLWRRLLEAVAAVYVVSAFIAGQATLLSLTSSVVVGMGVGIAVRFAAGSVNDRPDGNMIAGAVARQGFDLVRLEAAAADSDDHREYRATTRTGKQVTVQVFDRELIASGAAYSFYRILRLRAELAPAPALSLERVTEHHSLLAMAAQIIGVRTPRLFAGLPCGPDSIVLVYESVVATPLQDPTDPQLDELWSSVGRLHVHRVTHRGLTAGKIQIDPSGQIVLPIPADGAVFASDLRVSLDRAQLLITTAQLAGAERAVRGARNNLTDDELAAVLPVLQPIALSGVTRRAVKEHAGLLESVRNEIQAQTHHRPPEPVEVERIRPRTIL
ncbi:MAG TPA: hypothetical protein VGD53_09775, partial [Actinoallomurus sp.]